MNRKIIKMFILVTLLALLAGIASATDVSEDTTSTHVTDMSIDTTGTDTTITVMEDTTPTDTGTVQEGVTGKQLENKEITKKEKNMKTANSFNAGDYSQLQTAFDASDEEVTVNITHDITLQASPGLSSSIKTLTIEGNGFTINGSNQYRFLDIQTGTTVNINNLTITNCHSDGDGGAIYNNGTLNIYNSNLTQNTATGQYGGYGYGGAIYNNKGGTLNITQSNLTHNTANSRGGAIYNGGTLTLTQSNLTQNTATSGYGGAIYNDYLGNTTITNSVFYNNNANEGGGAIYNVNGIFNITNNIFYNNTPTNFIINQDNHIQIKHDDRFISIGDFSIIVDDEKVFNGSGAKDFNKYTLGDLGDHYIKLILNGTETNTINNVFILRKSKTKNVNSYQELIDAIGEAKLQEYEKYRINLDSGNYNAISNITLSDSATKNIIINGNGLTLNGKKEFQFIQIAEGYNLILENITITNYTAREGGVIYNNGNLSITDSTLENNQATETGDYGDVYAKGGVIYNNGNLIVTDSTLENNQATATITAALSIGQSGNAYSYGGAIYNNGNLIITNSTLENNQATAIEEDFGNAYSYGGAIYNNRNLSITDSTLENNQATATGFSTTDAEGGAIFNWNGNTTITRSTLYNNNANKWGGAICNDHGNTTITHSTLYNNNAYSGGAIYNYFGIYEVIHTIFYNNTPANFVINQDNHIHLEDSSAYITVGSFSLIIDDEVFSGFGTDDLNSYTISTNNLNVKLLLNGTETNTINNIFILRSLNVRGYQELVDAIEEAKVKEYEKYIINLDSGDYTATCSIDWRDSATRNIIIKGNGLTLNGKNRYQFINIASGHNLVLENITITNYTAYEGGAISNGGTLTIKNSTLENNHGTYGGAIYNYNGGNLTVTDSNLTNNNATTGGAINNYNGNITLNNTTLTYNNATEYGGAIVNNGTRSNLTIIDSKLENNIATGQNREGRGGAIYNTYGTLNITGSNLSNNTAGQTGYGYGGAIYNDDDGTLTITGSNVTQNTAGQRSACGGAIYNTATITITGSNLNNNTATGLYGFGGAIYNTGALTITDSNITNNNATGLETGYGYGYGGAINNYGTLTITGSNLNNNTATGQNTGIGGVIFNDGGTLNITNSNFTHNNATGQEYAIGGVIYNTAMGTLSITNTNLNNNTATGQNGLGGAIYNHNGGILNINNTNLTSNTATNGGAIVNNGTRSNLTIINSKLENNNANKDGGAIYNYNGEINTISNTIFYNNTPVNFIINQENHIELITNDSYICVGTFTIKVDENEVYNSDMGVLTDFTISPDSLNVKLILNGTDTNTIDNVFILRKIKEVNITRYDELVNAIKDASEELYDKYIINLQQGEYNANQNISLSDSATCKIIINGNSNILNGQNTYQFINIASGHDLTLNNITITNYTATQGGAICNQGTLTITDSTLTHNIATGQTYGYGGGIYNTGTLTITDSTLTQNTVIGQTYGYGGAIDNYGSLSITGSNLTHNTATGSNGDGWGGAIYNRNRGTLSITDSNFTYNTATGQYVGRGGAIYNEAATLNINNSNFTYNTATGQGIGRGGAIDNEFGGTITLTNSNFTYNTATGQDVGRGGAIDNEAAILNINNSNLTYNTATGHNNGYGGAIYNSGSLSITDSHLTHNTITGQSVLGSAINNLRVATIHNNIFTNNLAKSATGKAIIYEGQAVIQDNINADSSKYSSTIYTENYLYSIVYPVNITFNTFDDEPRNTSIIISANNTTTPTVTDMINITLELKDDFDYALERQTITVVINQNMTTLTTDSAGMASMKYQVMSNETIINATYTGKEDTYNSTNTLYTLLAEKLETKLLVDDISTAVGKTFTINGILLDINDKPVMDAIVNITVNGSTNTAKTDSLGKFNTTMIVQEMGEHPINVTFYENSGYKESNNNTANVTATKTDTKITLTVSNTTPINNTMITITVNLTDNNDEVLDNQEVTLNIGNETFTTNTTNGIASKEYTVNKLGSQTITATYTGNNMYNANSTTTDINVCKPDTKLTLNISNTTPINNTSINITATLTDTKGNKLANQNITITVGGKSFNVKTGSDGVATQSYTPTKVETQIIAVTYHGDSQYINSSANTSITVKKIYTKVVVKVSNSTPINNTSITITATLTDENNNKVANQNITITVGGKTFKVKTNSNGIATQSYTPTKVETQTITATYKGDSQYVNSTATANITVKKINSKLTVKASNTTPTLNTSINITATLTDANGNKVAGQNVTINVAGRTYTVKTDTSGVATKAYTPTTVGKQTITATYKGDSKYNNSTATMNITVNKINTQLTLKVSNNTPKVTDTITITATLTDKDNQKLSNQNITITVEDKTYTVKTNNNGIATQTHKLTRAGSINITVKYNGNTNYNPNNTSTKLTVKENILNTRMKITVNNTTPRVNDNVMVTFTLKDEKNNPIKNQEIKATINGVNTNVKTNTNGVATTNYTVAKKDRVVNITATYTGNTTLKATTGNLTIDKYYKVDMELLTGSFDSKPGQTVKLIAHIKDNGVDIDGGQLVFKLNGVSLKDENGSAVIVNIKNGLAVLEYKIPDTLGARTHNLTAVYASNTYGRVELTTPMTIGKYTTHIDVNPLYTTTDKITIKAQIVDQNNQALNKQTTISIKVNGKSYSLNTINGTIDYQISQTLKDGYYNITIISGENGKYLGANVKTVLIKSNSTIKTNYINNTLNKDTTAKSGDTKTSNIMSILTGSSTVKPGDRLKLIAHLSENQVDITGGQLVFKLNGVSLKDENGNAVVVNINDGLGVLDYKIPDTLGARTHNLTAVYSSKQYGRVELTTQLTMNRLNTHIEAEPIYTTGTTSYIKAKILDDNNQLINKQTSVVIKVDGKSYAFNTSTGSINYKVPTTLSNGLHQITIIAGENGKYISSRANTVLIKI